jgi:hypothetical protein
MHYSSCLIYARTGENFELRSDLNSEYRDKRKDAIKRVIGEFWVVLGSETHLTTLAQPT